MGLRKAETNVLVCLMIGRSIWGDHHCNSTFWKDSNGKTFGVARRRVTKRHHRAGYKNLLRSVGIILFGVGVIVGMVIKPLVTLGLLAGMMAGAAWWYGRKWERRWMMYRQNKEVITPMARALASIPQMADGDMAASVQMKKGWLAIERGELGRVYFPDAFHANENETDTANKLIEARIPKPVEVKWHKAVPIYAKIMTAPPLPTWIPIQDKMGDIQGGKRGEYVLGYDRNEAAYKLSHNGDYPMKAFSMGSSTGKSATLRVIAAQILHNDPRARIFVFDTKRISLMCYEGVPGVTLYNDPDNMGEMWKGWGWLYGEMRKRYEEKKAGKTDFEDIYWMLEEGNDFSVQIKNYYMQEVREKGGPVNPVIWPQYIAPLLWQGREVRIFGIAVEQNLMDRFFGNMSLRPAFSTIGMAGFKPGAVRTIIQSPAQTAYQDGQGRICVFEGIRETWVQVPYAEEPWLRAYASEGREKESWERMPQ